MWLLLQRAALLWALANGAYVYLVRDGQQIFRLESAIFILIAVLLPSLFPKPAVTEGAGREAWLPSSAWLALAAVGLWVWIYAPLLSFPLLSDDYVFLTLYSAWGNGLDSPYFFRPVYALVFLVLSKLGDGAPQAFHAVGFGLHLASSGLVFALARRAFARPEPALLTAALFLLNPLQLESVLWVSGLQELLWSFFALAALCCHANEAGLRPGRLAATTGLVALALASKETAVCLAALLPAADGLLYRWKRGPLLFRAYGILALELVVYLLIRGQFATIESAFWIVPTQYIVKQFISLPYRLFTQPWSVAAIDMPAQVSFLVTAIVLVAVFAACVRRGTRRLLVGPAIMLCSTLPLQGYLYVGPDLIAARYLYFPSVGWGFLVAGLAWTLMARKSAWLTLFILLVLGQASLLRVNLRPWRSAADLVHAMAADLRQGRDLGETIAEWEARTGTTVTMRDGVPRSVGGVGVFINGYEGFQRRVTSEPR